MDRAGGRAAGRAGWRGSGRRGGGVTRIAAAMALRTLRWGRVFSRPDDPASGASPRPCDHRTIADCRDPAQVTGIRRIDPLGTGD
jgi:hypothetical protein